VVAGSNPVAPTNKNSHSGYFLGGCSAFRLQVIPHLYRKSWTFPVFLASSYPKTVSGSDHADDPGAALPGEGM